MSTFSLFGRRYVKWLIILFFLGLVVHLSRSAWELVGFRSRVSEAEAEVRQMAEEKERLIEEQREKTSEWAVEREIREKLNMAKPGETVVIVPEDLPWIEEPNQEEVETQVEKPNWQKWWELVKGN